MKNFETLDIRPYQMLCLFCRAGCTEPGTPYYHADRLDAIQAAIQKDSSTPVRLRCNTDTIFRFQNAGRAHDTPEGAAYNDLRDLNILQQLGLAPGATLPAIDLFRRVAAELPSTAGLCRPAEPAVDWPSCRLAESGNYERGIAAGIEPLLPQRTAAAKQVVKDKTAQACLDAERLRIRPHHLLCMSCFHGGATEDALAAIEEDNLYECIRAMQLNPQIPVELVHGTCMICPPCSAFDPDSGRCLGSRSMSLRDDKKDLDTLKLLGLDYGDVLPAAALMSRLFAAVDDTDRTCGYGDKSVRGHEWSICGAAGNGAYRRAKAAGLGVAGVSRTPPTD
jgi:hypothetical protein